jgi:GT2 family glycosyltransferase/glycosyltransferase involved in cell wall biosynthesis
MATDPDVSPPESASEAALRQVLAGLFDAQWYVARYPDVVRSGLDPLRHFVLHGALEKRDPNPWFDSAWYAARYPDVGTSAVVPLLHYLQIGAMEGRNPHPRFDAIWYVDQHPEAAGNPMLFHLRVGAERRYITEKPVRIADYFPSTLPPFRVPSGLAVDVIVPVYKGLAETRRCLESVLADPDRLPGRVIVIDDRSPEPALSSWLAALAASGRIVLLRNAKNLGFVASVNRGMREAGANDVVLLNSDTEVAQGWLPRLAAQAYRTPRIASVSPFSNNATICGYPTIPGGDLPFGRTTADIDAVCRRVNAGRWVDVPTTVGFCMYIRRAALDDVGSFDETAFGRGYGEENDFCLRAAALGWRHSLACDVFVYHEGAVSFGDELATRGSAAMDTLLARYPDYLDRVARHARQDDAGPCRMAVTATLVAGSGLPVILLVCHALGGGVRRHIDRLVERLAGRAHCLLLSTTPRGSTLSVPAIPGHAELIMTGDRLDDLADILRLMRVGRVHIHHLAGMEMDVRGLIDRLGVGFDLTVHDYFGICPQVNLLPWLDGLYCGEPDAAACNACIADRPTHGARDILSWRMQHAWLFREAERVICPSQDVRDRLTRFGLGARAIVAPHEPVATGHLPLRPRKPRGGVLRVVLIGSLAALKGAAAVAAVLGAAPPKSFAFHLIGDVESDALEAMRDRLTVTGRYEEEALPDLIRTAQPHVLWFPSTAPETFGYTLSAAIDAGLPIVASDLGAFPERLAGRPLTWLVPPTLDAAPWLAAFAAARAALDAPVPAAGMRAPVADFYAGAYLAAPAVRRDTLVDLRRPGRTSVLVVPERFANGALTPCAYIRLILPLDHAAETGGLDIQLADAETAHRYRADIVATQRYAMPDVAAADRLAAHARETGAALYYDLDDDLLHIPRDNPDAGDLRPKAKIVRRMLTHADRVLVSTPALRAMRADAKVVGNALDQRLWGMVPPPRAAGWHSGPVRILCMGTATHDADFAMIEPALSRLVDTFGERVRIEMIGFSGRGRLPSWVRRLNLSPTAAASYPAFVNSMIRQPAWDIGLVPLMDTPFNRAKSALKTLDYAALGLALLASDVPVYQGSLADGVGGMLVPNTEDAWYGALARLVRDTALRRTLGQNAWEGYRARGTLAACLDDWRSGWARSGR